MKIKEKYSHYNSSISSNNIEQKATNNIANNKTKISKNSYERIRTAERNYLHRNNKARRRQLQQLKYQTSQLREKLASGEFKKNSIRGYLSLNKNLRQLASRLSSLNIRLDSRGKELLQTLNHSADKLNSLLSELASGKFESFGSILNKITQLLRDVMTALHALLSQYFPTNSTGGAGTSEPTTPSDSTSGAGSPEQTAKSAGSPKKTVGSGQRVERGKGTSAGGSSAAEKTESKERVSAKEPAENKGVSGIGACFKKVFSTLFKIADFLSPMLNFIPGVGPAVYMAYQGVKVAVSLAKGDVSGALGNIVSGALGFTGFLGKSAGIALQSSKAFLGSAEKFLGALSQGSPFQLFGSLVELFPRSFLNGSEAQIFREGMNLLGKALAK